MRSTCRPGRQRCIAARHAQHSRRRLPWQHSCIGMSAGTDMPTILSDSTHTPRNRPASRHAPFVPLPQHDASLVWAASCSPGSSTQSGQPGSPCWPAGSSTSAHGLAAARPQSSAAHSPWRWRRLPAGTVSQSCVCGGRNTHQLATPWAAGSMSSRAASQARTTRSPCMDVYSNDTSQMRSPHLHCCMCGAEQCT